MVNIIFYYLTQSQLGQPLLHENMPTAEDLDDINTVL